MFDKSKSNFLNSILQTKSNAKDKQLCTATFSQMSIKLFQVSVAKLTLFKKLKYWLPLKSSISPNKIFKQSSGDSS